jgi:hypothetical protein
MAKIVIGAEIKVDGKDAEKNVGSFKTQLKEANAELVTMSEKFGLASKEAVTAAKKVAGLKDAIGDAKQLAESFNPDKKFAAFSTSIQGVTSGFAALQGAQALFGSENKELEKTLLKVQSAMALSQGINGIFAAKDAFVTLGAVIKSNPIFLIATVAAAIGTALFALKDKVKFLGAAFDAIGEVIGTVVQAFKDLSDWIGISSFAADKAAERQAAAAKKISDAIAEKYDTEIRYAKAAGKETFELELKKREAAYETLKQEFIILGLSRKANGEFTAEQKKKYDDILKAIKDNEVEKNVLIIEHNKNEQDTLKKHNADLAKTQHEANKKAIEANKKKIKQLKKDEKALTDQKIVFSIAPEIAPEGKVDDNEKKVAEDNLKLKLENDVKYAKLKELNDPNNVQTKIERMRAELALQNSVLAEDDLQRQVNATTTANAISDIKKEAAKKDLEIHKLAEEQKLQLTSDSLGQIADIIGRQSAVGKSLAVGQAIINTYQGATKALATLPPPFGAIQAGITIAAGLANVKKILAVKVPGASSSGSVPSSAPISPQAVQPQRTTLEQSSINAIGNTAIHAFVIENDVSSNQEKIRRLNRAARIN